MLAGFYNNFIGENEIGSINLILLIILCVISSFMKSFMKRNGENVDIKYHDTC